jgi:fructoselysine 3-epimerase
MNKIANMNLAYRRYPLDYFLDSTMRLGLDAIELWAGEPHLYVEDSSYSRIMSILKKIKERDLKLICFTPEQCDYPINLAASDADFRKRSVEYFKKSIHIASLLECQMVLVSGGYGFFNESKDEVWKRARESLHEISLTAETEGIVLALEPFFYPYTNVIVDLQTTKQMISEVNSPSLKAMVDTPCMVLAGDSLDAYATSFGNDLVHIHLVDGDGKSSSHLSWGEGNFPLTSYLETLSKKEYNGYLTLELIGNNYLPDPETKVRESLSFLYNNPSFSK